MAPTIQSSCFACRGTRSIACGNPVRDNCSPCQNRFWRKPQFLYFAPIGGTRSMAPAHFIGGTHLGQKTHLIQKDVFASNQNALQLRKVIAHDAKIDFDKAQLLLTHVGENVPQVPDLSEETSSNKLEGEEEERWNAVFQLLNKNEISRLENGINLVVNCERDEKNNPISLFIADYGIKKEMLPLPLPNCTLFLNNSYKLKNEDVGNVLQKLEDHCEKLAHILDTSGKEGGKRKNQNRKESVDLKLVDFNLQENLLDNYIRDHYPGHFTPGQTEAVNPYKQSNTAYFTDDSNSGFGGLSGDVDPQIDLGHSDRALHFSLQDSQNVEHKKEIQNKLRERAQSLKKGHVFLYCFSSPWNPEICFGSENVNKEGFTTQFEYSIFNLSPYDGRPDYEIIRSLGLTDFLDNKFEDKKYLLWRGFVKDYLKEKPFSSNTAGNKNNSAVDKKMKGAFLKNPAGFLEWNLIKAMFLFIVFKTKLERFNELLKRSFPFKNRLSFFHDLPPTTDKLIEETFLRYLKRHVEKESIYKNKDGNGEKISHLPLFYFLMIRLGKLRAVLSQEDKEIVKKFLTDHPVKSNQLTKNSFISAEGIRTIEHFVEKKKDKNFTAKSLDFEDIKKITGTVNVNNKDLSKEDIKEINERGPLKDLSQEDLKIIRTLFSAIDVNDPGKQKECFKKLCELSKGAVQFTALECSSLNYFSLLHKETTAYLNGFLTGGFNSHLEFQAKGFKDLHRFLRDYSPFLKEVNHFVPFQFFSSALHFSPQPISNLKVSDSSEVEALYGTLDLEECLKDLTYPIGLPTVYSKTANQEGLTLKRFLARYQKEFFPHLWKIIVSGELTFKQDFLISNPLEDKAKSREEMYEPSPIRGGKGMFASKDLSSFTKNSRYLQKTVITQDILETLQKICSRAEMGEIYELEVETAVFWKVEDRVDKLENWYSEAIIDKGSFFYQEKETILSDTRTRRWYPIELSKEFIGPLIKEAHSIQKRSVGEDTRGCEFDVRFLVEGIYRVFTSSKSLCANVVLADVITARARIFMWLISKPLSLSNTYVNPINCGLNQGVCVKTGVRKPSLQKFFKEEFLRNHQNVDDSFGKNLAHDLTSEYVKTARLKEDPALAKSISAETTDLESIGESIDHKELVKGWAEIIKGYYSDFSDSDLMELEGAVEENSTIRNKIHSIVVKLCIKLFWKIYKVQHSTPIIMSPYKEGRPLPYQG